MATQKETVEFLLAKLRQPARLSARAMFGEYALYADGQVVALICDDQLYVKILPASQELETFCEKDAPYPGAKPCYLITERLDDREWLTELIVITARELPLPKPRTDPKRKRR